MSSGVIASAFVTDDSNEKVSTTFLKPIVREMADARMKNKESQPEGHYKIQIVWFNVTAFVILHSLSIYGCYLCFTSARIPTMIFYWIYAHMGAIGITAGAHRLWSHRTYKARLPMRIILMLFQSIANQNCIHEWVRDHRAHHKFTDTDADPHNSRRGFFFAHMGWLSVKKHPELIKRGGGIDMTDMANDPVVAFQKKYFYIVMPLMSFIIPTVVAVYFWNENLTVAFAVTALRYTVSLHFTWLVNSAAHMWGNKPYDTKISPTENITVALLTNGEGWHNYHHVFPWDYKAAELGNYCFNLTTAFIDFFALIGLAYDRKTVTPEMVRKRALKTGNDSWKKEHMDDEHKDEVWGWNDKDMGQEDKKDTRIS